MSALPGNMQGESKGMAIKWLLSKLKNSILLKLIVAFNAEDLRFQILDSDFSDFNSLPSRCSTGSFFFIT